MKPKIIHPTLWSALLLFLTTSFLAGCAGGFLSASSSTSPSPDNMQGPPAGAGAGMTDISGVITQYNAPQKTLTIRTSSGTTRTFIIAQATIEKSQAITRQTLKSLLATNNNMLRFTGQKSNSTTYTAQQVTVMALNASNAQNANGPAGNPPGNGPSSGGNPPTNAGTPPASNGGPMPAGTPPAGNNPGGGPGNSAPPNGTPPASNSGATASGTPQANNGNNPGAGNAGTNSAGIALQNVKMQNNQLLATTFSGQSITINLENSTQIVQQVAAKTSDLKTGLQVTIMQAPITHNGSTTASAHIIIIETTPK